MDDTDGPDADDVLSAETSQELATLEGTYETLLAETEELSVDVDDALGEEFRRTVELLKEARRPEQEIDLHQRGVLSHMQLQDQVAEDGYGLEANINRASRELDGTVETASALADVLPEGPAATLAKLTEQLEAQAEQLDELANALDSAHKEMLDDGVMWMD